MAARWKIVQSFIREATEDENYAPVETIDIAYAKLRAIQRGAYTTVAESNGLLQIQSKFGDTEFAFTIPEGISTADIMETVETAIQMIEGLSVGQARALLKRRKNSTPDYSTFRLQ